MNLHNITNPHIPESIITQIAIIRAGTYGERIAHGNFAVYQTEIQRQWRVRVVYIDGIWGRTQATYVGTDEDTVRRRKLIKDRPDWEANPDLIFNQAWFRYSEVPLK